MRARIFALVFASGLCSLIYQSLWMRELRLVFGASTAASAAVLAIFMAGLGIGAYLLGPRADRDPVPLRLYAKLEFTIAIFAALSPLALGLVTRIYLAAGGSWVLGPLAGTALRLALAALVLSVPTVCMGGTLPALVRAIKSAHEQADRDVGGLYGVNTLGAVVGTIVSTFVLVEWLGVTRSMLLAVAINLVVAALAWRWGALESGERPAAATQSSAPSLSTGATAGAMPGATTGAPTLLVLFVLFAAFVAGFVFFAMELAWYRLLSSLLGGSSYSFGLILTWALLGIAVGGVLYGAQTNRRPSEHSRVATIKPRPVLMLFALSCALEAMMLAIPWWFGDQIAALALQLRSLSAFGFAGMIAGWSVIVALMVFVPAVISGIQFPLLIGAVRDDERTLGAWVGRTYAANTAGSAVGAIASGFGLLAALGAEGVWRAMIAALIALAILAVVVAIIEYGLTTSRYGVAPLSACALSVMLLLAPGPTPTWRMAGIGAGRVSFDHRTFAALKLRLARIHARTLWVRDGVESAVGIHLSEAPSIIVNGKSDGSAVGDAATTVMAPLLGAALHTVPKRGLVIGLGTGESAGWLAQVQSIESVDVVELEPVVLDVARLCAPYSYDVLGNPKVHVYIGDGREFVMAGRETYDVIMSEPSNPYRAGVASLFSQDFYRYLAPRLTDRGVFVQWLQGYETDARTMRTVVATLRSVFPHVEIWRVHQGDFALVARKHSDGYDLDAIDRVLKQEPYRTALANHWGVAGVEGLFSGFVAGDPLSARILSTDANWIDTDDRPMIEFGFARTVGAEFGVHVSDIRYAARASKADRPSLATGRLDDERLREAIDVRTAKTEDEGFDDGLQGMEGSASRRSAARKAVIDSDEEYAQSIWEEPAAVPYWPEDRFLALRAAAATGNDLNPEWLNELRQLRPTDAALVVALHERARGGNETAWDASFAALEAARHDPWFDQDLMWHVIHHLTTAARSNETISARTWQALLTPFSGMAYEERRKDHLVTLAEISDFSSRCLVAIDQIKVVSDSDTARFRVKCFKMNEDPRLAWAEAELELIVGASSNDFDSGLVD